MSSKKGMIAVIIAAAGVVIYDRIITTKKMREIELLREKYIKGYQKSLELSRLGINILKKMKDREKRKRSKKDLVKTFDEVFDEEYSKGPGYKERIEKRMRSEF